MKYTPRQNYLYMTFAEVLDNPFWLPSPLSLLSFYRKQGEDVMPQIVFKQMTCSGHEENKHPDFNRFLFVDDDSKKWHNQYLRLAGPREDYEWPIFPVPEGCDHYVAFYDVAVHLKLLTKILQSPDCPSEAHRRLHQYRVQLLLKLAADFPEYELHLSSK